MRGRAAISLAATGLVLAGILLACAGSVPPAVEARAAGFGECAEPAESCVLLRCEVSNAGPRPIDVLVEIRMPMLGDEHVNSERIPMRLDPGHVQVLTTEFTGVERDPFTCEVR